MKKTSNKSLLAKFGIASVAVLALAGCTNNDSTDKENDKGAETPKVPTAYLMYQNTLLSNDPTTQTELKD